jgi:hypothetical protein
MNIKSFIVLYWSCNNKQTFTEQVERSDVTQENDINTNTLKRLSWNKLETSACRVYKLFLSACKDSHMYNGNVCGTYLLLVTTNFMHSHACRIIFWSGTENYSKAWKKKREYKYFLIKQPT